MKIGFIIPATSNKRDWKDLKEVYLFKYLLRSFVITCLEKPVIHQYKFYIGIDKGDPIYDNKAIQNQLIMFVNRMKNTDIEFVYLENVDKGHVTEMWNILFKIAYDDNCDYFFQCGDDIQFKTKRWIDECILTLEQHNNIGLVGPKNNHPTLLTQSFVSRKHMEIFGFYFPVEIRNWFCDDWINGVYKKIDKWFPLENHTCINMGGDPRYVINDDKTFINNYDENLEKGKKWCNEIIERDYNTFLKNINYQ